MYWKMVTVTFGLDDIWELATTSPISRIGFGWGYLVAE